jgi:ABC-2 type transport system permease protein
MAGGPRDAPRAPGAPDLPGAPDVPGASGTPGAPRAPGAVRATLGLYGAVATGGFRRYATYRAATLAGVFTNTVFGLIVAYTYLALWHVRPHLGGYDRAQAVTYVWIGQGLLMAMALMGGGCDEDLTERIRSGDVATDLHRPADLQAWWLATDLGRAGFHLVARGVLPIALGALVFPVTLPAAPGRWLAFLAAVLLGLVVSFALRYLAALTAFWLLDGAGVTNMAWLVGMFFSGMLLPLTLFPGALGVIARRLPWAAMLQTPADVLLGRVTGGAELRALGWQLAWAVGLLALGRLVQAAALRKVVLQGG